MQLPRPGSKALHELVSNEVSRQIYRALYQNRGDPLSIHDIRQILKIRGGEQQHLDRRLRQLDPFFEIARGRRGRDTTYSLIRSRPKALAADGAINKTLRAWVLRDQRCAQCGRTPTEDAVKLHVDHKVPQRWGGTNDPDNLQALCSECNEGKKDYYATLEAQGPKLVQAFRHDEPHVRIGEVLKAAYPEKVRGDLLERAASAKQYQEDWQKRLRELRALGWRITASRQNELGRAVAYYRLERPPPQWPKGSVAAEIRRREAEVKKRRGR
jgi:hypothetical protein